MENLPFYVYAVFGLTVLAAIGIFYKATNNSKPFLTLISVWIGFQTILGLSGFYKIANTMPPRFVLLLLPPTILIITRFSTENGRTFMDQLDIKKLTLFHILRIPVEIVLFWLFTYRAIPGLMTFEGRNFDIFSGITAPMIYYFGFIKKQLHSSIILFWNFICLALLLNIAFNAILSLPTSFQQFAFDQPNIAILYFPFVLLPACLVPMVLFSHLVSIRQILKTNSISVN
ncbi:MAG: hypothetical protein K2Q21_14055 [Chitinophagaceae bacterium]|nr:hypothetical protein [Chitinophagaceae bacterium]